MSCSSTVALMNDALLEKRARDIWADVSIMVLYSNSALSPKIGQSSIRKLKSDLRKLYGFSETNLRKLYGFLWKLIFGNYAVFFGNLTVFFGNC